MQQEQDLKICLNHQSAITILSSASNLLDEVTVAILQDKNTQLLLTVVLKTLVNY
jgi:hypothetical protein